MIFDATTTFSSDQAIIATANSTNVIDLGTPRTPFGGQAAFNADVGKGSLISILAQVTADFNNATSIRVDLVTSANEDLSAGTVVNTETLVLADLVAGRQTYLQYVPNGVTGRYLGLVYTLDGTAPTEGTFTAGITLGNQTNITGV